jgi:hypothetical protein
MSDDLLKELVPEAYFIAAVATIVALIIGWILTRLRTPGIRLRSRIGGATWSFKDSWSSTLTAVGAILGTVLAVGGLIKDESAKSDFAVNNLFFGVVIIVAVLLYNATRSELPVSKDMSGNEKTSQEPGGDTQYKGWVWALLVACWFILWATLGQLWTLFRLLHYISHAESSIPQLLYVAFTILLVVSAVLSYLYVVKSVPWTIKNQFSEDEKKEQKEKLKKGQKPDFEHGRERPTLTLP